MEYKATAPIYLPQTGLNPQPTMVDDPNATPDKDGYKYVYAGTPVGGDVNFLTSNTPTTLIPTTDPAKIQGILMNDQDITKGSVNCSVLIAGTINENAMQPTIKSVYSEQLVQQLKTSLPNIQVINKSW